MAAFELHSICANPDMSYTGWSKTKNIKPLESFRGTHHSRVLLSGITCLGETVVHICGNLWPALSSSPFSPDTLTLWIREFTKGRIVCSSGRVCTIIPTMLIFYLPPPPKEATSKRQVNRTESQIQPAGELT